MSKGNVELAMLSLLPLLILSAQIQDSRSFTTGVFKGCPPEGIGGDPYLNQLQNRDIRSGDLMFMTMDDLLGNKAPNAVAIGAAPRAQWNLRATNEVFPWEQKFVQIYGYLAKTEDEGPEPWNGDGKAGRSTRMWIVWSPYDFSSLGTKAVVAEISPRLKGDHPFWNASWLNHVVSLRQRVRISGWLLWNETAVSEIGKSVGTAWEIAPVHRIEVFMHDQWHDFLNEPGGFWGGT